MAHFTSSICRQPDIYRFRQPEGAGTATRHLADPRVAGLVPNLHQVKDREILPVLDLIRKCAPTAAPPRWIHWQSFVFNAEHHLEALRLHGQD